jgi:hypothetical protein
VAEIKRVANVTERDVIAAVVAVVRAEGRERGKAETPARLLKRHTPGTDYTTESTPGKETLSSATGKRAQGVLVLTCRPVSLSEF